MVVVLVVLAGCVAGESEDVLDCEAEVDDVIQVGLCATAEETEDPVDWAGEPCGREWESNVCRPNGTGLQYCYRESDEDVLLWGDCVAPAEVMCELGEVVETERCVDDGCEPCTIACIVVDGVPRYEDYNWELGKCETPLVLSFDGAPVQMQPAPAATFDISDAGGCTTTDWPAAVTPWLALDRDGNGAIESGRELFGSGTRLASGRRASNGFVALTELDDNSDGRIDPTDGAFADLVLWSDEDADKRSTWFELQPLSSRGILSIELDYGIDRQCDDRGNCAVERASFTFIDRGGEIRDGEVVDMHLACQ